MRNWKTTTTGICAIIAAICGAVTAMLGGHPVDYPSVLGAVMAGVGLIAAHDASNTIIATPACPSSKT